MFCRPEMQSWHAPQLFGQCLGGRGRQGWSQWQGWVAGSTAFSLELMKGKKVLFLSSTSSRFLGRTHYLVRYIWYQPRGFLIRSWALGWELSLMLVCLVLCLCGGRAAPGATDRYSSALLVMFICNHCPFVKHLKKDIAKLMSISSNSIRMHPQVRSYYRWMS